MEHRQRATTIRLDRLIVLADIHLRVLRVLRFQFSWLQPAQPSDPLKPTNQAAIGRYRPQAPFEHPSQRRHTAIHEQQGAGDIRSIVGGQNRIAAATSSAPPNASAWCLVRRGRYTARRSRQPPRCARIRNGVKIGQADGVHPECPPPSGQRQPAHPSPRPPPWWCHALQVAAACKTTEHTEATLTIAPREPPYCNSTSAEPPPWHRTRSSSD